jgi:hypothetical protein
VSSTYTVSASETWEKKVITFPADATGAFVNTSAVGLLVQWWLAAGSDYTSGTLRTTWTATSFADWAVGQVNVAGATSNYWQVTGLQLELGDTATDFEFESFGETLAACQRYFYRMGGTSQNDIPFGVGVMKSTTTASVVIPHPVTMRATPASSFSAANTFYLWGGNGAAGPTAIAGNNFTIHNFCADATRSSTTQNTVAFLQSLGTANAFIDVSAEL